jgi:hypothetical protein
MIRRGHVVAIALVLLCNAVALIEVARDRRDPPRADLWLTERELPVLPPEQESSVLLLELRWNGGREALDALFDEPRLRALGVDCSVPASSTEAPAHYGRQPARAAWVVLESAGEAWARWREGPGAAPEAEHASRLFLVDAGPDPDALRRRYPDGGRTLILPVHVEPLIRTDEKSGIRRPGVFVLWETARWVMVPASLRAAVEPFAAAAPDAPAEVREPPAAPRYRARLRLGARDLPRLEAVEPEPAR